MNQLLKSFGVAVVLTGISYLVAWSLSWITFASVNPIEAFAVFTSFACTYLCVKEDRFNYPLGIVSSVAYAIVFYQAGFLGSMALAIYLIPTLIFGWFRWGRNENTKPVQYVLPQWLPVYVIITFITYLGAVWIVTQLGGTLAGNDGLIVVGSIAAQYLLDNKKIETWFVWAAVNVVAIYTYSQAEPAMPLVVLQYVFFLGNTIYGWLSWHKSMEKSDANTPVLAARDRPADSVPGYEGA